MPATLRDMLRATALTFALALPAAAQAPCSVDAMVVFDGSASMAEPTTDGMTRISELRDAVADIAPQVAPFRRIGLLTYGPDNADACAALDLRFLPQADAAPRLIAEVNALVPDGLTPLTASVEAAAEAMQFRTEPAVIVLVTDGNETCGRAPCTLADRLHEEGLDLTVHVLGFKVTFDFFAWNDPAQADFYGGEIAARCLADATGGEYVSADTVDDLVSALHRTLGCPLLGGLSPGRRHG